MFFPFDTPLIRYTGRWGKDGGGEDRDRMTATALGAYFEFAFEGELATIHFDLSYQPTPYPHIWISVDGGPRTEGTLAPFIRIQAPQGGKHTVCVILKGSVEKQHRWYKPLAARISLLGIETEALTELKEDTRKIIEFVGDSITEGVMTDVDCRFYRDEYLNRPFQDDVCATYAWRTAEKLNLRPCIMAYGAVGTTQAGNGAVPRVVESYPFNFDQSPISFPSPDYILICHGTNDHRTEAEYYCKQYRALLDVIRELHPYSKIIALSAFYVVYPKELCALIKSYNEEHGTDISFIDGSGWVPKNPVHPLRDGHAVIAEKLCSELKKIL